MVERYRSRAMRLISRAGRGRRLPRADREGAEDAAGAAACPAGARPRRATAAAAPPRGARPTCPACQTPNDPTPSSANHAAGSSESASFVAGDAAAGRAGRGRATDDGRRRWRRDAGPVRRSSGSRCPIAGCRPGTVSVRVARKMPANAVADAEVSAIIRNAGGDLRKRAAEDRRQRPRAVRRHGARRRVPRRGHGRRRAPEDRDVHDAAGGRPAHDVDLGRRGRCGARRRRRRSGGASRRPRPRRAARTSARSRSAPPRAPRSRTPRCRRERWRSACSTRTGPRSPTTPSCSAWSRRATSRRATARATPPARRASPTCPSGAQTGYAAVIDWKGLRLNTVPFAMPESGGARAEIRALARTADPAAITIGAGGRIVVQMREDTLQILEFLPLENTSDKMFDPGPGAFEIPLPERLRGRAGAGQRAQGRGPAEPRHGRARPDRPQAFAADRRRRRAQGQRSGVRVRAALPWRHARLLTAGAERNRSADPDHRAEGHRPHRQRPRRRRARGARAGRPQVLGHAAATPSPPAGALKFTLSGLPSTDPAGGGSRASSRWRWSFGACVFARRPTSGAGGKRGGGQTAAEERTRLVGEREALFASWWRWSGPRARHGQARTRRTAASSSSRGWSRFTRTSPRWTSSARHEPGRKASSGERARAVRVGKIYAGRRALARRGARFEPGPGGGGARSERRRQVDAARHPVDAGVAVERPGPLGRRAARARVAAARAHRLRRPRPGRVRRPDRAREPVVVLRAARLRRDRRPGRDAAGARRAGRRARRGGGAHVFARHAAAAGAGARAGARSGAAAVRRAVVGAGSRRARPGCRRSWRPSAPPGARWCW